MINKEFIDRARSYQKEIYQDYGPYIYQPMAESTSIPLPVTLGCSYNACLYCDLNHEIDFRVIELKKIEEYLIKLKFINKYKKRKIENFVLLGGNPFVLETDYLLKISDLILKHFEDVKCISSFARADDVLSKSLDELRLLKKHRYNRLSLGIESGSDQILKLQNKGLKSKDNLLAMKLLEEAGLDYSCYIMLGLGGEKYSHIHALETAKLLNMVHPFELTIVTMVLFKDAPLVQKVRDGSFKRLSPLDSLREEYSLLENLSMDRTIFNASHKTNVIALKGLLQDQKSLLLDKIQENIDSLKNENLGKYEHNRWNKWSTE